MRAKSVLLVCLTAWTLLGGAPAVAQAREGQDGPPVAAPDDRPKKAGPKKAPAKAREKGRKTHYTVIPGDSLASVAKAHGVKIGQIKAWNNLEDDNLSVGKKLLIYSTRHVRSRSQSFYIVKKGDTPASIAKKHKLDTSDLLAWNPRIDPRKLSPGTKLRVYAWSSEESGSSGSANAGGLAGSVSLSDGPGYRVRSEARAYGTPHSINLLAECLSDSGRKFPAAKEIMVGDISYEKGGHMSPHRSHQSGRDADISYYIKGVDTSHRFVRATAATLDVEKTWFLFERFLKTNQVEYIFVDHPLQKALYEHAKKKGAAAAWLDKVFQYPQSRGSMEGIIRYSRGHDDHFHIRFKCAPDDKNCK